MTSQCRKFVPNVFDIKKCQNCFKSKEFHSRSAVKDTMAVKKVVACSYLFISPHGLDFRNVVDRSKRWQRRFFVLHDDGELLFSIDENSQAIPQGRIHLSNCRSVHSGEEITGHANSIALHLESGESYFLRAASRDEVCHWERLLSAYCPGHQKMQSPLTRFQKFSRSISGPLVPQPPPRQQPPRPPQKSPPSATSPGTAKVCNKEVEYIETDLDYDLGGSNSKSANNSPFGSKFAPDSRMLRRRPGSVGDQLKSLLNSPGAGSPQEERSSSDGKELTYLKKGWLYVQAPTDSELQKRWCVLSDGCVTIYRSALAEDNESPEFALPLLHEGKGPVRLHEAAPDLTYGFLLETAVGNRFAFSAMTAGIRSNWVQALRTCLRLRTAASRCVIRRVPAMRRHTTGTTGVASTGGPPSSTEMSNGSDVCDAEVSQILTKKSKMEEPKPTNFTIELHPRHGASSKTSFESSLTDNGSLSVRSGRSSREAAETAALRSRVAELATSLESSRAQVVDLEAKLSLREAECLGLSDQCQRLELDVFERERIVALPTDEERQLKRQLAAHDEALRASHQRCERAERCVDEINQRLSEQLSSADAELTRALLERDEALREKAAAVADRDALERRWRAERSHWEAALAQNEAENARLEAERRAAEEGEALARGAAARGLEAKVATAAERLANAAVAPNAWGLAAAVALCGGSPALVVAPLRAICGRQVSRLVRWLSCSLEGSLLQEESEEVCSSLLQQAARRCLERCCSQLGMEVPEGVDRRLASVVRSLLRGLNVEGDEEELEGEEMTTSAAQVLLLALLMDETEEEEGEEVEPAAEIRDFSLLSTEEWREASVAAAVALMETSHVTPLQAKLKKVEEESERLRAARADLKQRLTDVQVDLRSKESELLSATEALQSAREKSQKLEQEKSVLEKKEMANEAPNGRREPSEAALQFWRRELRCALETELRNAESAAKERHEDSAAVAALREQLAADQAAHREEVMRLRAEFEAALAEEARQTRVAVEAIAREHKERLEKELERCREELKAQQQPVSSWLSQSPALESHLESLARRLAGLPSCENGVTLPTELSPTLLQSQSDKN